MTAPLYAEIDLNRLPRHVAIIMDGNGRWAKQHKVKVALGHRTGTETLREIIRSSSDIGIEALSLYAFPRKLGPPRRRGGGADATDSGLFASEIDELDEKNVRITILGDKDALPPRQRDVLREAERRTLENTGLRLNIAINYGARAELARAARQIAQEVQSGTLDLSQVDEKALSDRLYTHDLPDVDLLIRTSGEMRLSNFLLYQCAYAEFLFPTVLWPDFTVEDYHRCIAQFQGRKRRFGKREE